MYIVINMSVLLICHTSEYNSFTKIRKRFNNLYNFIFETTFFLFRVESRILTTKSDFLAWKNSFLWNVISTQEPFLSGPQIRHFDKNPSFRHSSFWHKSATPSSITSTKIRYSDMSLCLDYQTSPWLSNHASRSNLNVFCFF